MEYCGGGDLSGIIKQASKQNRPISEDTIWNYFMQILLALHHCHHPNGHGRSGSGSGSGLTSDGEGSSGCGRRPQILHRDLKPDNGEFRVVRLSGRRYDCDLTPLFPIFLSVFLDENNNVKLGDFGLSKALAQASFANTYVGVRHRLVFACFLRSMTDDAFRRPITCPLSSCKKRPTTRNPISGRWVVSFTNFARSNLLSTKPRHTQSSAYSLGASLRLLPPSPSVFLARLTRYFYRNGRIPPLPRGYSQSLFGVIKAMLNLNVRVLRLLSSPPSTYPSLSLTRIHELVARDASFSCSAAST